MNMVLLNRELKKNHNKNYFKTWRAISFFLRRYHFFFPCKSVTLQKKEKNPYYGLGFYIPGS